MYKNALEEAGIMIDSKSGLYGGYTLIGSNLLGVKIDKKEISTLEIIKEQLIYNNDMNKDEFINILDKLKVVVNSKKHDTSLANKIMRSIQSNYENKMYITVQFKA